LPKKQHQCHDGRCSQQAVERKTGGQ
jgi:hypothetical protein